MGRNLSPLICLLRSLEVHLYPKACGIAANATGGGKAKEFKTKRSKSFKLGKKI